MRRATAALLACAVLLADGGCFSAPWLGAGSPDWRDELGPAQAEVFFPGAGDDECSIPGLFDPWIEDLVPIGCCYVHDAVYASACLHSLDRWERTAADFDLAACIAKQGRPEWVVRAVLEAVRIGGWTAWTCGESDRQDGRLTDPPMPP